MHESYLPPKIYIINHISGNCRSASDKLMPDAKKNNNENLKSLAVIYFTFSKSCYQFKMLRSYM